MPRSARTQKYPWSYRALIVMGSTEKYSSTYRTRACSAEKDNNLKNVLGAIRT
jgi:hypothetical protein